MANEANDATEANDTERPSTKKPTSPTVPLRPLRHSSIKSSEWYFGICVDRNSCNNQLGSSCNNELVVINADLDKRLLRSTKQMSSM